MLGKNLKGRLTKHFLGIDSIMSGNNTPFRKFVGDIRYHFSLLSNYYLATFYIVWDCCLLLCPSIHSHIIFIIYLLLFFKVTREIYYFIFVSTRIYVKAYPSQSFPFTYALLLLYLICKDHLFFTFLSMILYFTIHIEVKIAKRFSFREKESTPCDGNGKINK